MDILEYLFFFLSQKVTTHLAINLISCKHVDSYFKKRWRLAVDAASRRT